MGDHPLGLEPSGNLLMKGLKQGNLRDSESLGVLRSLPDDILLHIFSALGPEVQYWILNSSTYFYFVLGSLSASECTQPHSLPPPSREPLRLEPSIHRPYNDSDCFTSAFVSLPRTPRGTHRQNAHILYSMTVFFPIFRSEVAPPVAARPSICSAIWTISGRRTF